MPVLMLREDLSHVSIANVTVSLQGRWCFVFVCFSFSTFFILQERKLETREVKKLLVLTQLLRDGSAVVEELPGHPPQHPSCSTLCPGDSLVSCSA